MLVRAVQPAKVPMIASTLSGSVTVVNAVQFSNARSMLVTPLGIVIPVRAVHPEKAYSLIFVTLSEIVTFVKL